jgi:hypothetical protein
MKHKHLWFPPWWKVNQHCLRCGQLRNFKVGGNSISLFPVFPDDGQVTDILKFTGSDTITAKGQVGYDLPANRLRVFTTAQKKVLTITDLSALPPPQHNRYPMFRYTTSSPLSINTVGTTTVIDTIVPFPSDSSAFDCHFQLTLLPLDIKPYLMVVFPPSGSGSWSLDIFLDFNPPSRTIIASASGVGSDPPFSILAIHAFLTSITFPNGKSVMWSHSIVTVTAAHPDSLSTFNFNSLTPSIFPIRSSTQGFLDPSSPPSSTFPINLILTVRWSSRAGLVQIPKFTASIYKSYISDVPQF